MNFTNTLLTVFELALVAFTIWAVFNEDKFVAFEERFVARIRRRRFKVIEGNRINKSYYPVNNRRA